MVRNAAIKRYELLRGGCALGLFDSSEERRLAVLDLLSTEWFCRASELDCAGDAGVGRRIREPVAVTWSAEDRCPVAFARGGREYHVESIVQTWAVEHAWWDPAEHISRRCWRVLTKDGGPYDLAFDRMACRWILLGIQD